MLLHDILVYTKEQSDENLGFVIRVSFLLLTFLLMSICKHVNPKMNIYLLPTQLLLLFIYDFYDIHNSSVKPEENLIHVVSLTKVRGLFFLIKNFLFVYDHRVTILFLSPIFLCLQLYQISTI